MDNACELEGVDPGVYRDSVAHYGVFLYLSKPYYGCTASSLADDSFNRMFLCCGDCADDSPFESLKTIRRES